MLTAIKFCGLTNLQDALNAIQAGATLLGFNFYPPSPRYILPQECAEIVKALREQLPGGSQSVKMVGVFVNLESQEIINILDRCPLDLAQLSGDESPATVAELGDRAFKVLRLAPGKSLAQTAEVFPQRSQPPAFLIDAHIPGEYGGTGKTADWLAAREFSRQQPVLLAGGLHPGNVAQAVRQVRPWGVDVASGIESAPGIKDRQKMLDFVQNVHQAKQE